MKVNIAARKMKSGKLVRENRADSAVFRLDKKLVYRKVLNFPWEKTGTLEEFQSKFINDTFDEVVVNPEHGLGFEKKSARSNISN